MGLRCPALLLVVLAGCLTVGVNTFTTTEPSAHHEVKAVISTSVDLPCDVNLERCGSTVHSVKVYKNKLSKIDGSKVDEERVFSLVRSNDSALAVDAPDGVLARPKVRAKFNLETDPPTLHIDHVFLVDEGEYRCDVTYVEMMEGCRTTAKTTLITLKRPDKPEIRLDHEDTAVSEKRIGPYDEGKILTLICEAPDGKPPAQITWLNGSEPMAKMGDKVQLGTGIVEVKLTRADLDSRFRCEAMNDALDNPYSTWVKVDVRVRPLSIEILYPKTPIIEDRLTNLTCEVRGARPAAYIEWLNGTDVIQSDSFTNEEIEEDSGENDDSNGSDEDDVNTKTTRSVYTFMPRKHDYGVLIHCRGRNAVMENDDEDLEDSMELDVHYAPRVTMEPSGYLAVNFSGSVEFTCRFDANPDNVTRVRWQRDGVNIDQKTRKKSDDSDDDEDDSDDDENKDFDEDYNDDDDDDDDLDGRTAKLKIASVKHSDKGVYSCVFGNSVGRGISTTTLTLDVYYPPVTEIELVPSLVHEHEEENVTLQCDVVSANPDEILGYRWFKNDQPFAETENDTFVLVAVDRFDVGNYSCSAQNEMGWGAESDDEELLIMFLPGPSKISFFPAIAVKGSWVTLTCSTEDLGQPKANLYKWYRDDFLVEEYGPELKIEKVTTQVLSNFSCAAVNVAGEGPAARTTIPVVAAPEFVQDLPPTHGALADATAVSMSCWVECKPICEIGWQQNGRNITKDNKLFYIKSSLIEQDLSANRLESVLSTLYWNMSRWNGLKRHKDDAFYTCFSAENYLGDGVRSTTNFRVEYPPEGIYVSHKILDVIEGSAPDIVQCSAQGLPPPTYRWTFGDVTVSSSSLLNLSYSFTRDRTGNYSCNATNGHGFTEETTFINVQYKPTCNASSKIAPGGQVVVECIVDGNPDEITYDWTHDGGNVSGEIEDDGLRSVLTFFETSDRFGTYQCIATNDVGSSDPCSVTVSEEGGWWARLQRNRDLFIVAACVAALLLLLVLLIVIVLLRRKSKSADDEDGTYANGKKKKAALPNEPTFYENLPFHGLQAPPNKPFKPILPDLEYADVDFPARPLNNNQPISKAKIVEKILEEADDDGSGKIPARPPRSKPSTRK